MATPAETKLTERVQAMMSPDEVRKLDEWRRQQAMLPSRSQAIRFFVCKGMDRAEASA